MKHMKTTALILGLVISAASVTGQNFPLKYSDLIRKADSLYTVKDFKNSANAFSDAFRIKGCNPTSNERYNAACSWALAACPDSAFYQLNYLATLMNYTSSGHLKACLLYTSPSPRD